MRSSRNAVRRLVFYLACCELLVTAFCVFVIYAGAGYHADLVLPILSRDITALIETRRLEDGAAGSFTLALWLASSSFIALALLTVVIFNAWVRAIVGGKGRLKGHPEGDGGTTDSATLPGGRGYSLKMTKSIWQGMSLACSLLGILSLLLYFASLLGLVFSPTLYSVVFVFAFALCIGSGFGGVSGSGAAAKKSGTWVGRFKAAPLWMRLAILIIGSILVFVCVRTVYVTLTHPALYSTAVGSTNLAAVGSFLFFVDALAFRPT